MPKLTDRLLNILVAEDEAANAALGGHPRETISGSIGRAVLRKRWWAPAAEAVVDAIFSPGHCERQAEKEARRRGA